MKKNGSRDSALMLLKWLKGKGYLKQKININSIVNEFFEESPERIIKIVGFLEKVPEDYYLSKSKKQEISQAKQIAVTLLRSNTYLNYKEIADYFEFNKSNAMYSHKTMTYLIETNIEFRAKFFNYLKILNLHYVKYKGR